jgi:hypothetical protein
MTDEQSPPASGDTQPNASERDIAESQEQRALKAILGSDALGREFPMDVQMASMEPTGSADSAQPIDQKQPPPPTGSDDPDNGT